MDDSHLWLKPGTGWELGDKTGTHQVALEGGATDERPKGSFIEFYADGELKPDKHMNRNTGFHKFWNSALENGFPEQEQVQASDRFQYEEKDANIWVGLVLDVREKETTGTFRQGPDKGKEWRSREITVAGVTQSGSAPAASASTPAAAASNGAMTAERATELAKEHPEYIKFLEAVTGEGADPTDEYATAAFHTSARGG